MMTLRSRDFVWSRKGNKVASERITSAAGTLSSPIHSCMTAFTTSAVTVGQDTPPRESEFDLQYA